MGMAPYGEPRYLDKVYKLVQVNDAGSFRLNMEYFAFHKSTEQTISSRFIDLFGAPRRSDVEFYTLTTHPRRDHPQWDDRHSNRYLRRRRGHYERTDYRHWQGSSD